MWFLGGFCFLAFFVSSGRSYVLSLSIRKNKRKRVTINISKPRDLHSLFPQVYWALLQGGGQQAVFSWSWLCQMLRHSGVLNNISLLYWDLEVIERYDGKFSTRRPKYHLYFRKGLCLWAILNPRSSSLSYWAGLGQASPWSFWEALSKLVAWRSRLGCFPKAVHCREGQKQALPYRCALLLSTHY